MLSRIKFSGYSADGRRLYLKGSSKSDNTAAEQEAARQARIAAGTDAVNAIFGVGSSTSQVPTGEKIITGYQFGDGSTTKPISVEQYNKLSPLNNDGGGHWVQGDDQWVSDASETSNKDSYTPIYQDVYQTVESDASKNAAARSSLYDSTKEDTRAYYAKQLEEDREDAERQLKFAKARMGIVGSSMANDMDTEYQKALDKGLLSVANRADTAYTNLKNNDETARLNLISKIVAGVDQDTAVANALSTLQTNAEASKNEAQSEQMANVFSDLLNAYNTNSYNKGAAAAKTYGSNTGNYFSNTSGTSGTVSKSGT
jgi:hypothetical protein